MQSDQCLLLSCCSLRCRTFIWAPARVQLCLLSQPFRTSCPQIGPRSTCCVFLGYSADHKGYRCLDLFTNNIVISQLVFDETVFPFTASPRLTNDLDIFLLDDALGAATIPAPLPAPCVPLGCSPLAVAGGQIALPGNQSMPETEDGGLTVSPGD
jgi:hypothetical protein